MLTPSSSSTGPVCFGTPVHTHTSTTRFFDTKHLSRDEIICVMSLEMAPFFLGPMPPQDFLSTFLPSLQPSSFQVGMFDTLTNHRTETLMYKAFIGVVQPHLKTIHIRDTSRSPDRVITEHSVSFSPDCTVYDQANKDKTKSNSAFSDICIEFKIRPKEDAFLTDFPDEGPSISNPIPLMSQNQKGIATASQITTYVALQLDCQYRTHVFSVLIVRDYAQLIRWDWSGAIVTAPIFYQREPELMDFFTRYDQAARHLRGHDDSVRRATPGETQKAVCAHDDFYTSQGLLVVTVPHQDGKSCGEYVIKLPVAQFNTPPGRTTRTSITYDIHRDHVIFFKDSWRVNYEGIMREGETYKLLNDTLICNIPHCSASGDVGEDTYHSTRTDQFTGEPWVLASSTPDFTPHWHHQLILDDIGKRLETFRCSRDMVRAILAALIAHHDAYEKCGVLHCDISVNNILLTECSHFEGGLLIDWDLCKLVDPNDPSSGGARQSTRMGTWQFMAADLIENPKVIQTFIHDIESAFLVLLWVATHYVTPNTELQVLSSFVNSVFNPQVFGSSGGSARAMFMRGEQELDHLIFQDNVPLTRLLHTLKELLSGIIDQALHEGAQGTKFPSNPTTADDTLQEAKLFQA
ncbi:hypothetical protein BJY52DRAFT_1195097 [Lactarius psammicola]|nr:hypothetical protein BJY52DRAFT_1195097 [Lactarius psammicola]